MTAFSNFESPESTREQEALEAPQGGPEVLERSQGRRRFSGRYKARILAEYDSLSKLERGALLSREGLYSSLIVE